MRFLVTFRLAPHLRNLCVCGWARCSPPSPSRAFRFDVTSAALPAMPWDVFPGPFLLRPIRCEFLCSWSGSLLSAFLLPGFPTRCDQQGSAAQALGCASLSLSALPHTFGACVLMVGLPALRLPLPRLSDWMKPPWLCQQCLGMCFLAPSCSAPSVVNFCVHGRAHCSPPSSS